MKFKFFVLIITYIIAFYINLIPSIKHPDSSLNIFNLLATALFLLAFLVIINEKKKHKIRKIYLVGGITAGLLIFVIVMFEDFMFDYVILDAIASIQYPLYLLFTTPLFGANMLFDLSYATFSLLMSLLYLVILFLGVVSEKRRQKI